MVDMNVLLIELNEGLDLTEGRIEKAFADIKQGRHECLVIERDKTTFMQIFKNPDDTCEVVQCDGRVARTPVAYVDGPCCRKIIESYYRGTQDWMTIVEWKELKTSLKYESMLATLWLGGCLSYFSSCIVSSPWSVLCFILSLALLMCSLVIWMRGPQADRRTNASTVWARIQRWI